MEPSRQPRKGAPGMAGRSAQQSRAGGADVATTFGAILPIVGSDRAAAAGIAPAAAGSKGGNSKTAPGAGIGLETGSSDALAATEAACREAPPLLVASRAFAGPHVATAGTAEPASPQVMEADQVLVSAEGIQVEPERGEGHVSHTLLPDASRALAPGASPEAVSADDVASSLPRFGTMASDLAVTMGRPAPEARGSAIPHRREGVAGGSGAAEAGASIVPSIGASAGPSASASAVSPARAPAGSWTVGANVPPGGRLAPEGKGGLLWSDEQSANAPLSGGRIDAAGQVDALAIEPRGAGSVAPASAGIVLSAGSGRTSPGPALVSEAVAHAVPEARGASPDATTTRSAPAAPIAADLNATVRSQIANVSLSEGRTRVELTPRGLGDIEIDLRQEGGQLRVVLRVENPAVLAVLRQDRDGIVAMLRDGGVDLGDGSLGFESFDGHRSRGQSAPDGQGPAYGRAGSPWEMTEDGTREAEPPAASVPRAAGSGPRLDLIT